MTISRAGRSLIAVCLVGAASVALARPSAAQAVSQAEVSPVTELLKKASNALNDLHYATADTLARQVLALGSLITAEQQLAAVQIRIGAFYPEEAEFRKTDSAVASIRQMIALGGTSFPKDIQSAGLDALLVMVQRASSPAKVVLGSKTPLAVVYVNGVAQGTISSLRTVLVSPAVDVKLSIRADKCVSWDTVAVFRASDSVRVGIRNLQCPP